MGFLGIIGAFQTVLLKILVVGHKSGYSKRSYKRCIYKQFMNFILHLRLKMSISVVEILFLFTFESFCIVFANSLCQSAIFQKI